MELTAVDRSTRGRTFENYREETRLLDLRPGEEIAITPRDPMDRPSQGLDTSYFNVDPNDPNGPVFGTTATSRSDGTAETDPAPPEAGALTQQNIILLAIVGVAIWAALRN